MLTRRIWPSPFRTGHLLLGFTDRGTDFANNRPADPYPQSTPPVQAAHRYFMVNLILPRLRVGNKKMLLEELSRIAAPMVQLDRRALLGVLLDREKIGCTGIGQGVALPHARFAAMSKPVAVFARLTSPIEYEAVDGRRVDLVYLLLGPKIANDELLKMLACAARTLRDQTARLELRQAEDEKAIRNILIRQPA